VRYGLEVAGGDTDWDGFDEIACGAGPSPQASTQVVVYDYDGIALSEVDRFNAFSVSLGGARLSFCHWSDADINRELIASRGPLPGNATDVAAFDDGSTSFAPLASFEAYPGQDHGVTLSSVFPGF
jgi:hypothetical protein